MRKISMAAARTDANMTQADMAKYVGVSKNLIIDWEKGRKHPTLAQFEKYCRACGWKTSEVKCDVLVVTRL